MVIMKMMMMMKRKMKISTMIRKIEMKLDVALAFQRPRQEECLTFNTTLNHRVRCRVTTTPKEKGC